LIRHDACFLCPLSTICLIVDQREERQGTKAGRPRIEIHPCIQRTRSARMLGMFARPVFIFLVGHVILVTPAILLIG